MVYYNRKKLVQNRKRSSETVQRRSGNMKNSEGTDQKMQTDRKELRYLGLENMNRIRDGAAFRGMYPGSRECGGFQTSDPEYPLIMEDDGTINGGCFRVKRKFKKNLAGCDSVLVMAVTVGAQVDRLLARYGKLSVAKAVVMQAAAAAMVEATAMN